MTWPTISAAEALSRLRGGAVGLDVRSEKEFAKAAVPGFVNVPILNDEHRHLVGLEYKNAGPAAAIKLGISLTRSARSQIVARFRESIETAAPEDRLVICWRGGLRSQTAAEWLERDGVGGRRVRGGYKAIRQELLVRLERPPPLLLLSGMTGSGKTEVLRALCGVPVLDFESLAAHRGSAFGGFAGRAQPSQGSFENALAMAVASDAGHVVEDESMLIGRCAIPLTFRRRMVEAPAVILDSPIEDRVRRIFEEYVRAPAELHGVAAVHDSLRGSIMRIERALGGLRARQIRDQLDRALASGFRDLDPHVPWIETLLREYYDPRYVHAIRFRPNEVLFRGDAAAVKNFIETDPRWRRT